VSLVGFKKVLGAVAANDWLEKHSAEHRRPYWWNQRTGKSTWSDPGGPDRVDECVQEWLQRVGVIAAGGASNPLFDPSGGGGGGGGGNVTAAAALDIETIFREIDVDFSGRLEAWEFIDWWRGNGGDPSQVPLFEECFELVGAENDGVAGVSLVGFKKVLGAVAANDWLEKHSAEHRRPYWWNQRTGKSTWSDPGGPDRVDECVQEWLQRVGVMRLEVY
jgi:hypothetical protein